MTKAVRIENADNSNHKVQVYCEEFENGEWHRVGSTLARIDLPTMLSTQTIWKGRRVVVEEVES